VEGLKKMKKINKALLLLLLSAFILRLLLAPFGTLRLDMNSWTGWATRLSSQPLSEFYNQWSDYLPGYLYVLWFLGNLQSLLGTSDLLFKMPGILADLGSGYLIYWLLRKKNLGERWALTGAAIYLFNPAVWANSALWGQVDGLSALIVMASLSFLAVQRYFWAVVILAPGFIIKPQTILLLPLVALVILREKKYRDLLLSATAFAGVIIAGFIPFWSKGNLFTFIWSRLEQSFGQYPYTSLNAFNIWGITGGSGWWVKDSESMFGGISYQSFGVALVLILFSGILWRLYIEKKEILWKMFLGGSLFQFLGFFLMTRVHERHLLPVLAPLTVAAVGQRSLKLFIVLGLLSLTYIANLGYAYIWITENFRKIFTPGTITLLSIINFLMLALVLDQFYFGASRIRATLVKIKSLFPKRKINLSFTLSEIGILERNWKAILIAVVVMATVTRFWRLETPNTYMFDEVYHAFTAREIVNGNKAAWEWWNTPPQGFAFEWSHPPLAKELMAVSLSLNNSPLGWRIPGTLLGSISVIFVFLIAWEIFHSRSVALLSAFLFASDTLSLVMARIGMNDTYLLFFILASIWLALRKNYPLMGVTWGFALASKWTALYLLGFLGFLWLIRRMWQTPKETIRLAISSLIVAPFIYLFSYLPFFAWGHTFAQFNEVQHQMWWYHTGLKATHPFQSDWWSWPLTLRPVWIAVEYGNNAISNVYAQGNPFLYWTSIIALLTALAMAVRYRLSWLFLVIIGYSVFFLPWALSPRIMFIYHYLPSIPFVSIATAWFLLFLWGKGARKLAGGLVLAIFLAFVFFYPHVTGVAIPSEMDKIFYWLGSWK